VDTERRRAAKLATAVAVPVALLVGVVSFAVLKARTSSADQPVTNETLSTTSASTVPMVAPSLTPAHATMCLAFIAALPTTLNNLAQRRVSAGPEQNIAFGDPAITAACGTTEPKVAPTDEVYTLSQVCWYESTGPGGTAWTTLDRAVPVTVTVPDRYTSPGQWVTEFSNALVASVPAVSTPYNC